MLTSTGAIERTGLDALAIKPAEVDLETVADLAVDSLVFDYEGHAHLPETDWLAGLARDRTVRLTVPVRADGFDPLGDDSTWAALPESVGRVLVAGHPAYLEGHEAERAIAPRLRALGEQVADPWVGTEGIERLAMATGGTQFELLSRSSAHDVRGLRAAGYEGELAVYAPTVLATDEDTILDAVGGYVARRGPVADAITGNGASDGAVGPTDATATGRTREVLLRAATDYALVGDVDDVSEQVAALREAGVDTVVGYPADGLDAFLA